MSENEMTPEQEDEIIEQMRWGRGKSDIFEPLALRRIDALTAKVGLMTGTIYALRDELARAYTDLADMHEGEGYHNDAKRYRARAAALEAPADGSADADADAADGSGG
jgi:hypothetical protein